MLDGNCHIYFVIIDLKGVYYVDIIYCCIFRHVFWQFIKNEMSIYKGDKK